MAIQYGVPACMDHGVMLLEILKEKKYATIMV